jgi:hypothetical protein
MHKSLALQTFGVYRTSFAPETISPERNDQDQFPTKMQQDQRSRSLQPNKNQAIHGTQGQSLRQMPALDVKLMTKDQDLGFQRGPRPEQ